MKVRLNEKQLKTLISKHIKEVEDTSSPDNVQSTSAGPSSPSSGTSSSPTSTEGGSGYPQVSTWSDVVGKTLTRGVDNQIDDNTKWEDEINTSRGPGNQLSEQEGRQASPERKAKEAEEERQRQLKINFDKETYQLEAPKSYFYPNTKTVFLPKVWNGIKTTATLFDSKNGKSPSAIFFGPWKGTTYEDWIDDGKYGDFNDQFPDGTVRSFNVGGMHFFAICERLDNTKTWKFKWFVNKDGKTYNWSDYFKEMPKDYIFEEGFWDNYGPLMIQMALSIAVAIATGGESFIVQCMTQLAVQVPFSIKDFAEGHNWSAIIAMAICFLPIAGKFLGLGTRYNIKVLGEIGTELKGLETIEEVEQVLIRAESRGILDKGTKVTLSRLFKQTPEKFEELIGKGLMESFKTGVRNGSIVLEEIPFKQLKWWKHLLVEGGVGLVSLGGAQYVDAVNETREQLIAAIKKEVGIGNQKLKTDDENSQDWKKEQERRKKLTQKQTDPAQHQKTMDSVIQNSVFGDQGSTPQKPTPQPQQTQPDPLVRVPQNN